VPVSDVVVHVVFGQVEHVLGKDLRLPGVLQAQLRGQVQYLEDHRCTRPGTTKYILRVPQCLSIEDVEPTGSEHVHMENLSQNIFSTKGKIHAG
jgi:hypothetical protein